jgi:sortase (surface protein transpeptidase)
MRSVRRRGVLAGLAALGGVVLGAAAAWPEGAARADDGVNENEDNNGRDAGTTYGPANWIRIPRIDVDSATIDVGVSDGYYDVPWFDVGHHVDSVNPGELGNSVFNGHVLTINAGRVFYRLKELVPDDAVFVYTPTYRTGWAVVSTLAVADGDDSFLLSTPQPQITLYTCSGDFNPLERSFTDRLVVVAQLVEVVARTS